MNRLKLGVGALVLAAVAGGLMVYGFGPEDQAVRYITEDVSRGEIESVVVTTGTLEALNTIVVGSQLSGQIQELHADFNDVVTQNELMARIDPRTFEARVEQNRADVAVAQASIEQRKAEVVRAQATLAQARRELTRRESLKEKGHVSESELDQDQTAVETASAQVKVAEASVVNAEAVLVQRKAALNQALIDLERTYIRSPVAGTVINRTVEMGQTVAASLQAPELFQIAQDLHKMKVEASVDEADIGRIAENLVVRFSVDAYPERAFRGRVQQIRKAPDKIQNVVTYRVIIEADNADLALLPGMTANVEVVLGRKVDVVRVPNAALRFAPKDTSAANPERRGPGALMEQLRAELDLSANQNEQLDALMAAQRERMRSQQGTDSPPNRRAMEQMRQRMMVARQAMNAEIRKILEPGQRPVFEAIVSGHRSGARRGTVWVLQDGEPQARQVVIGLADDDATEIVRGLEAGEQVIVRATRLG